LSKDIERDQTKIKQNMDELQNLFHKQNKNIYVIILLSFIKLKPWM